MTSHRDVVWRSHHMANAFERQSAGGDTLRQKILSLLGGLRQSAAGRVVHDQVAQMLDAWQRETEESIELYAAIIDLLLDGWALQLAPDSPLRVHLQLLRTRLRPPLHASEFDRMRELVAQLLLNPVPDEHLQKAILEPLLASFGILESVPPAAPATGKAPGKPAETATGAGAAREAGAAARTSAGVRPPRLRRREQPAPEAPSPAAGGAPESPAGDEGELLRTNGIQALQADLDREVESAIARNQEFGVLLEVVLNELQQAGEIENLEDLRWTLIREVEKLREGHRKLVERMDATQEYLRMLEQDSRQLSDELIRTRLLSLTDELTGLSNRRAFLRRLEDEVARAKRYGFPLSLVLIDLDFFKEVNDRYGHAAGDEVLRVYARNILSIFRHHDLVARYGGEEFAVLLPNTDLEGARRALEKVQRRCRETRWQSNGDIHPVPTFSAGLALYKPGETPSAFMERVDKALYRAKRLGRDRIEIDMTYKIEDEDKLARAGRSAEE